MGALLRKTGECKPQSDRRLASSFRRPTPRPFVRSQWSARKPASQTPSRSMRRYPAYPWKTFFTPHLKSIRRDGGFSPVHSSRQQSCERVARGTEVIARSTGRESDSSVTRSGVHNALGHFLLLGVSVACLRRVRNVELKCGRYDEGQQLCFAKALRLLAHRRLTMRMQRSDQLHKCFHTLVGGAITEQERARVGVHYVGQTNQGREPDTLLAALDCRTNGCER